MSAKKVFIFHHLQILFFWGQLDNWPCYSDFAWR